MKIQLLSTAGAKYLGFAKNKFSLLQDQRLDVKLPALSRTYSLLDEGIRIDLFSSEGANWIRISGGGIQPQIILSSGTDFAQYNYYNDKLRNIVSFDTTKSGNLVPIYNGRSETDAWQFTYGSKWENSETPNAGSWLGGIDNYELSLFHQGNTVYGKLGDTVGSLAIVPHTFLPEYSNNFGSLFGLSAVYGTDTWNLYDPITYFMFAPENQSFYDGWYWTPSFFFAGLGDPFYLFRGAYYGSYPSSEHSFTQNENGFFLDPLVSATVTFKGTVNQRYNGGFYRYGWCEYVTNVVTTSGPQNQDELFFYLFEDLPTPPNPEIDVGYSYVGITSNATITFTPLYRGFPKAFKITPPLTEFEVEMWNLEAFNKTTGALGYVIKNGAIAYFYRFSQYNTEVYSTTNYHSHSLSKDGRILAVFEGSNLIERVLVFDLSENKADIDEGWSPETVVVVGDLIVANKKTGNYAITNNELVEEILNDGTTTDEVYIFEAQTDGTTGELEPAWPSLNEQVEDGSVVWKNIRPLIQGGFTELQDSTVVSSVGAYTGCLIPFRKDGSIIKTLPYDLAATTPSTDTIDILTRPSFAALQFNRIAIGSGTIHKVTCTDGVTAKFSVSYDECADNTYVLEFNLSNDEKLVGRVNIGGGLVFSVRGDFFEAGEDITFEGVGSGETVQRPETFQLFADASLIVSPQEFSYIGELQAGACISVDDSGTWRVDTSSCEPDCDGKYTFSATTSCGQTGTGTYIAPIEPLELSTTATSDLVVGDVFSASGGVPPYTFSFDGGTICSIEGGCGDDVFGEIQTITDCGATGTPRSGTVTVTDSCGNTASQTFRLPNGVWRSDNNLVYCGSYNATSVSICGAGTDTQIREGVVSAGTTTRVFDKLCVTSTGVLGVDDTPGPCTICLDPFFPECDVCSYYEQLQSETDDQVIQTCGGPLYKDKIEKLGTWSMSWQC